MLTTKLLKSRLEYEFRAALNKAEKEIVFWTVAPFPMAAC
jgi:hypothetical protein